MHPQLLFLVDWWQVVVFLRVPHGTTWAAWWEEVDELERPMHYHRKTSPPRCLDVSTLHHTASSQPAFAPESVFLRGRHLRAFLPTCRVLLAPSSAPRHIFAMREDHHGHQPDAQLLPSGRITSAPCPLHCPLSPRPAWQWGKSRI
jgi:hypothetical protein